jgi:hypothetical protein
VTDIFREVEEDVRRERFQKLWKQYGDYIFAGVAAIAIGIAGYKLWDRYQYQQHVNASKTLMAAQQAADAGDTKTAQAMFGKVAQSGPSGYVVLAKLAEANTLLMSGKSADAIALYKSIAESDKTGLGDVARIRAAWVMVETAPRSDVEAMVSPLNTPDNAWRFMAQEVLAYADYRSGAIEQSGREYKTLADNKDAPASMRNRANAMATFIKTGGERDFGTVPRPPAPTPLQQPEGQPTP